MLGRWKNARLRTAEKALAAGRLDEAFVAATHSSLAKQSKAKKLLDQLVEPLLARARVHAQGGRYAEALADLDRLAQVNRGQPERDRLRERLLREQAERVQRRDHAVATYEAAQKRVNEGRLESARLAADRVGDDRRRERLMADLDARAQRSAEILAQARTALERGDLPAAARYWDEAVQRHGRSSASDAFVDELRPALAQSLNEWLASGDIVRFMQTVGPLSDVLAADPGLTRYVRTQQMLSKASEDIAQRNYDSAKRTLLKLAGAVPNADWVQQALGALGRIQSAYEELLSSPLGLLLPESQHVPTRGASAEPARFELTDEIRPAFPRSILMLDGACAALILTQDVVRFGRQSHSASVDVPLPADVQAHHADIYRQGEDYFLVAHGATSVNQKRVTRELLRDGDRIKFADRAKFVFRRPSRRSGTAVLTIAGHARLANDVSEVVLLADTCLIGPNGRAHLQTPESDTRLVLSVAGTELSVRDLESGVGRGERLEFGQHCQIGDQGITLIAAQHNT
jgi:hypothetical protein